MTAGGPTAMVAYWLIPAETARSFFVSIDRYDLNPHLSLIYKKMAHMAKLEVSASVRLPFTEVLFDLAKAVICPAQTESRQDVESWRVAAVQRLTE
jgi:hypothetical protein